VRAQLLEASPAAPRAASAAAPVPAAAAASGARLTAGTSGSPAPQPASQPQGLSWKPMSQGTGPQPPSPPLGPAAPGPEPSLSQLPQLPAEPEPTLSQLPAVAEAEPSSRLAEAPPPPPPDLQPLPVHLPQPHTTPLPPQSPQPPGAVGPGPRPPMATAASPFVIRRSPPLAQPPTSPALAPPEAALPAPPPSAPVLPVAGRPGGLSLAMRERPGAAAQPAGGPAAAATGTDTPGAAVPSFPPQLSHPLPPLPRHMAGGGRAQSQPPLASLMDSLAGSGAGLGPGGDSQVRSPPPERPTGLYVRVVDLGGRRPACPDACRATQPGRDARFAARS
jgi:hypothetical protein